MKRFPVLAALIIALLPAATFASSPTPTPTPSTLTAGTCRASWQSCANVVLSLLNAQRARVHIRPLTLSAVQSRGETGCPGSYGHSWAMARSGQIWHIDSRFPRASFPHNVCLSGGVLAENVGVDSSGDVTSDLRGLTNLMMSEPHSKKFCAHNDDHACNILDPQLDTVGIGIYFKAGSTWLTEDFAG